MWGIATFAAFVAVVWWSIQTEAWFMIPLILIGLKVASFFDMFFDR